MRGTNNGAEELDKRNYGEKIASKNNYVETKLLKG